MALATSESVAVPSIIPNPENSANGILGVVSENSCPSTGFEGNEYGDTCFLYSFANSVKALLYSSSVIPKDRI